MRALFAFILLSVASGPAFSEPLTPEAARKDYAAANELGLEGDFAGAQGLYQSLIDRGAQHPDLLYNLGNTLAAQGQDVEAVITYEQALRLDPGHEDARHNLEAVRARLRTAQPIAALEGEQNVALVDVFAPLLAPISATWVSWGTLAAELLLFGAWAWARRARQSQGRRRATRLAVLGGVLTAVLGLMTAGQIMIRNDAVAIARAHFELRQGPDGRFDSSGAVSAGARLRVLEVEGRWSKVVQQDGTSGWAHDEDIKSL